MPFSVVSTVKELADRTGGALDALESTDAPWVSRSEVHYCEGVFDRSIEVTETNLATVRLKNCYVLEGCFPASSGAVLFEHMHHNGNIRAQRYHDDAGALRSEIVDSLRADSAALPGGRAYYLLSGPSNNLWHFIYNFCLRLAFVIEKNGSVAASPYHYLVPEGLKPDFLALLHLLGVPQDRIVAYSPRRHIFAGDLTVTQVPFSMIRGEKFGSKSACRLLRPPAAKPGGPKRVYISRKDAVWRQVLNEDAVRACLAERGFTIVSLTDMSVQEMAECFGNAEIVVGSYGANLAATFFCRPGTRVVELSYKHAILKYYFQLASHAHGFTHDKILGIAERSDLDFTRWNFTADIAVLKRVLAGIETGSNTRKLSSNWVFDRRRS